MCVSLVLAERHQNKSSSEPQHSPVTATAPHAAPSGTLSPAPGLPGFPPDWRRPPLSGTHSVTSIRHPSTSLLPELGQARGRGSQELLPGREDPAGAVTTNAQHPYKCTDHQHSPRACLLQERVFGANRSQTNSQGSCAFGGRAEQLCTGGSSTGHGARQMFCCSQCLAMACGASGNAACLSQVGKHRPRDSQNEKRADVIPPKAAMLTTGQAV